MTKKRIESLTPAQIAKFPEYVKKWTDIGLSTAPADRPRAEVAIRKMYEAAGLKAPKQIIWCGSPLSNALVRHVLSSESFWKKLQARIPKLPARQENFGSSVRDSVRSSVSDSVWDSVVASVWDSVRASVRASVRDSVRSSVSDSVWDSVVASVESSVGGDSVRASVSTSVRASVGVSVWDSVEDSVGDSVRDSVSGSVGGASVWDSVSASVGGASVRDSVYGQHDAGWLSFYDYFMRECGLISATAKLDGLWELAQSAGWAIPMENACLVSERPRLIHLDTRGRLHNPKGPALEYPDGFRIYAINGVRTTGDWIEDRSKLTVHRIEAEQNAEVRRVMIEQYSQAKYLIDSGAKQIAEDDYGVLYRKDIPGDEPLVMVKVVNSTAEPDGSFKDYFLRVDPELRPLLEGGRKGQPQPLTARNAIASTFGKTGEEYAPALQT